MKTIRLVVIAVLMSVSAVAFADPSITSLSPTSGSPGAAVTISGSGFGASQGAGFVTFNGQPAPITSWSDTSIGVTVPGGANTGNVVVSQAGPNSNAVAFTVAPIVTGVTPSIGTAGTSVTITGLNFTATPGAVSIVYASVPPSGITSWSNTSITATVPNVAALYGPVTVTAGGMTSNNNVYFNVPPPHISSVSPATGPVGTQITVRGSGFQATQGNNSITINGYWSALTGVTWSDTQINGTIAYGVGGGPVQVVVNNVWSNPDVTFSTPNPVITSVSPTSGTVGAQVQINGSGFGATQGNSTLWFCCWASGSILSWSDTQIVATVPAGAASGTAGVVVNVGGVNSNSNVNFNVSSASIYSVTPKAGLIGSQVTVNGAGFGATQDNKTLQFYGGSNGYIPATISSWSDTQIVATVPSGAQTGALIILVNGSSRISNADVLFTIGNVIVSSVNPTAALPSTHFQVNGSGFGASQGSSTFRLGNSMTPTIVSWSDSQITAVTPPSTDQTQPAVVTVNGVVSNSDVSFTILEPSVASISPTTGTAGTQVQINGNNFGATQGSSTLKFNGQTVAQGGIGLWSNTMIVAMIPTTAASGQVQVNVGGLDSSSPVYFTVPPPQITGITPSIGGTGNSVTIAGSGFGATAVTNGVNFTNGGAAAVSSWSDTQIVATVPGGTTTGPVRVWAANNEVSNVVNYTVPSLKVSTLSPDVGPVGTQVTIHGVGFGLSQGISTLSFNGQTGSITSWSDAQIVATVPATAITGPVLVTVNGVNSNDDTIFYVPGPSVNNVTPGGAAVGAQVTITGSGFQTSQSNSTVTFNGTAVPQSGITSWSDGQIVAKVPTGATTGPLTVTVNGVSGSASTPFEVESLTLTSLSPSEAPQGGIITINGTGFGSNNPYAAVGYVYLNGTLMNVTSWSNTVITAQLPPYAASGDVTVTKYNTTSNALPLTIVNAPAVTSVTPAVAPVNGTITIAGSSFGPTQSNSVVQFWGGVNAAPISAAVASWTDTQITATVPPGAITGPVGVVVAGVGGQTANFVVNTTVQVTDSLSHVSSYTSEMRGGAWYYSGSTGAGCSSCTVHGNLSDSLDAAGNALSHTDELGHVTSYTYDAAGNLTSQSQPLDGSTTVQTSYTYNSFGEPLTVSDPLGNVTTNTYDANGNLLTVTTPSPDGGTTPGSVTQFAYDAKGQLTQITDPLGNPTTLTYTPAGLIATIKDAQHNLTTYGYDPHGNRTSIIDALTNQTTFSYDAGDRLKTITYPDQTFVSFGYDTRGRRTSVTDQNGKVTSYAYDDADRLVSVTDAQTPPGITQYAYDTENNLVSITDANNHTTSFSYDAFGRVTQTAFSSTLTESYLYDAAGNLTSKTDRNNNSILYVYDALNRLTHKGYPDSTGVDYVYDLAGKIKQVTDPTGTYSMAYDNMGRLIGATTQYSFLPGRTYTNAYTYDAASNRTGFTAPDGSTDTYGYDTLNRLTTLTDSGAGQFGFSYDGLSRRTQLTRPNGVNTNYGYDSVSNLQSILHNLGVNTLDGSTYTYDAAHNRNSMTNQLNSAVSNFAYDNIYQLTGVTGAAPESYTYDAVGNRLSSASVATYTYNSSNEMTSAVSATYTYDNNGNTLTKTDGSGTTTYTWDFENHLTSVQQPSQPLLTFRYDPLGRRVQKGSSVYSYEGMNLVEETDAGGNLTARYVFGQGVDEPVAAYRGVWKYYQADVLGSITSLTTASGTASDRFVYSSFGNLISSTGSFTQPFGYTGREYDSESGLYFDRARYYDPSVGRFLSEDAAGFAVGSNFYPYVWNNPAKFRDPSGMNPLQGVLPWLGGAGGTLTAACVLSGACEAVVVCFATGPCEMVVVVGSVVVGVAAIGYLAYDNLGKDKGKRNKKPSPRKPKEKCDKEPDRGACAELYVSEMAACEALYPPRELPHYYHACVITAVDNYDKCLNYRGPGSPERDPVGPARNDP
jgi:RHS repeat-associated protein